MKIRNFVALSLALVLSYSGISTASAKMVQRTLNQIIYSLPPGPSPVAVTTLNAGQGKFWLTDFPNATGDPVACAASNPAALDPVKCDALSWLLPPWFPTKSYIYGATIGQQQIPDTHNGQFAFGIDRHGLAYRNGKPPWHQVGGDMQWRQLCSMWPGTKQEERCPVNGPPVLFDRTAGDRLWIEDDTLCWISGYTNSGSAICSPRTMWLTLAYEADDTDVPPTLSGWTTLFGPVAMERSIPGWSNYTIRASVNADWFDGYASGPGTKTRVTLAADHISSAYICPRALFTDFQCLGSQQQLTFNGGAAGATAVGGVPLVTDPMSFGIDPTNGIVVTIHTIDGAIQTHSIQPSVQYCYETGDRASNPIPLNCTTGSPSVGVLVRVENFY